LATSSRGSRSSSDQPSLFDAPADPAPDASVAAPAAAVPIDDPIVAAAAAAVLIPEEPAPGAPASADAADPDEAARRFAVDPLNNVVLEASAGTGKTSVLVSRYLNLLRAGSLLRQHQSRRHERERGNGAKRPPYFEEVTTTHEASSDCEY